MMQDRYAGLSMVTPRSIRRTVMCDERTCLWFRKLFTLPKVVERLRGSAEGQRSLRHYHLLSSAGAAVLVLALLLCLTGLFLLPGYFLFLSGAGAAGAAVAVMCILRARDCLADVAGYLIALDMPEIPPGVTLYQVGEMYARKYGVPSLVKVIWIWDQRMRDVFLALFFIPFGVLFLSVWKMFVWLAAGTFLMACGIKVFILSHGKRYTGQ